MHVSFSACYSLSLPSLALSKPGQGPSPVWPKLKYQLLHVILLTL